MLELVLFLLGLLCLAGALVAPAIYAAGLFAAWAAFWGAGGIVGQLKAIQGILKNRLPPPAP